MSWSYRPAGRSANTVSLFDDRLSRPVCREVSLLCPWHIREIDAKTCTRKPAPVSDSSHMQFGLSTEFVWYRFLLTNRKCSILLPVYGTSFYRAMLSIARTMLSLGRLIYTKGLTENDGHENDGPSKLQDMKLQDMKMTDQVAWREIGGHEIARHETGGQTTEK